jgi:LPXTG-site transpeptidase (sortase) family protein
MAPQGSTSRGRPKARSLRFDSSSPAPTASLPPPEAPRQADLTFIRRPKRERRGHDAGIRDLGGLSAVALAGLVLSACGSTPQPTLRSRAASYHDQLQRGQHLGRLVAPRLRASVAVRVGFEQSDIDRGPGWWRGSYLPGEGGVTFIAGHRLTHGGPFRWVGHLRIGDRVVLHVPYADAVYVVTRRAFVSESRRTVVSGPRRDELRLLTSTVPPSHRRLVVFARASSLRPRERP